MEFHLAGIWSLVAQSAIAQQFAMRRTSYELLNLSGSCFEALNTTVDCSDRLAKHVAWDASSVDVLDQEGLEAVCQDTCRQSLVDLRAKVLSSCDAEADTIQYSYMSFPSTYIVDRYLYFYDVSCYKDRFSGAFCDTVLAGWRNEPGGSQAHFCDDCWLGPMSVQLKSPIGFNKERVEEFSSLTRSCSVYDYTTPTPTPYGETIAGLADVTTSISVLATGTSMAKAAATEVTSAEEMMPPIYPLLEVGTAARVDANEGKDRTKRQRRSSLKNKVLDRV
ncbi:putative LysM domain-containing protein [Colletotrichum sublineola]|uniref:Putative LysM domain-containing protein n=1 Tax=Colletotrichum sublineola TaxID=1173701 RepID=A0A066XIS0_COLSU|nr:putative LysM domain-containing protein [Colletotrichum sublineola]